jgi:hypothetical protein
MINQVNEKHVKGDTYEKKLKFKRNGELLDITGYTVWMTVKRNYTESDDDAALQIVNTEHENATSGITILRESAVNMKTMGIGTYVRDIQIKDNIGRIRTVLKGSFEVVSEVTEAA